MKKIFIILILSILVSTFPSFKAVGGGFEDAQPENKEWDVRTTSDIVRYASHGNIIYGHEFGFIKKAGNNVDMLWISWSTSEDGLEQFKGKNCTFLIDIDGELFEVELCMVGVYELTTLTTVVFFTNGIASPKLIKALEEGELANIEIVGPKKILDYFDIPSDSFNIDGYVEGRQKAKKLFEELKSQKEKKADEEKIDRGLCQRAKMDLRLGGT
ncbi:MAG: hypothetical protein KAJ66_01155 [Candidatus Omnitrophica bacterium]|nr:hypothetical protein [Candidatus Omnitrophota bacterium]